MKELLCGEIPSPEMHAYIPSSSQILVERVVTVLYYIYVVSVLELFY